MVVYSSFIGGMLERFEHYGNSRTVRFIGRSDLPAENRVINVSSTSRAIVSLCGFAFPLLEITCDADGGSYVQPMCCNNLTLGDSFPV
jgi:hypothetical protein